ncbi:dihydropteroate synthase [Halovivax ruber XH-70]|uniref:dihydropteroate synthase n=1 Tax=Halovivax ruber (strain DSM 18193 / JCM 13892 / XH-70) TaxID=797302 RepID=L0IDK2_HALRX|nr:dihydropteroate synthase [Halovivax ruber]AGB16908.1 dihydropteroate synthase [Halovivax ruber XH-70]
MEYHEAADRLYDLGRFGIRPGTASTADVLAHLDDPHESIDAIQLAGSNGKGSTARMLESVLRAAGHTVGLYTSPHLEDMRERIRVDGRPIPKAAVSEFVAACDEYLTERGADGASPTFFETTTAMALWHFAREDVDYAVMEVGIGGKEDATSVVEPVASAVTSVALEHTTVLGDSVPEIARDMAHVAPAVNGSASADGPSQIGGSPADDASAGNATAGGGPTADDTTPLVTAADGEALGAIREVAPDVVTVGDGVDPSAEAGDRPDVHVTYEGRVSHAEAAVTIDLSAHPTRPHADAVESHMAAIGAHQAENAGVAVALARQLVDVSVDELRTGLRRAHWPGRFEVMDDAPLVVLDGAHNPAGCERFADTLSTFEYDDLHLVVGVMHDKDYGEMVAALPTPDSVVACRPTTDRSVDPAVLARLFEREGVEDVRTISAVRDGFEHALAQAEPGDAVVVAGSLYAIAEARTHYTLTGVETDVRDLSDARRTLERANVTEKGVWRMRGKAVHRTVHLRLQERQAAYLKQELLSLGGECALSGLQREEQLVEAVCMGTLSQFKRLVEKLDAQPYGLAAIGAELRETLGIGESGDTGAGSPSPHGPDVTGTEYPWGEAPAVMGILNVTPDSFHDGGEYDDVEAAVARAASMVDAGATIIDVGGESTRPGAEPVPVADEIDRVVPVIERIRDLDAAISIDTRKAAVAEAALDAGADIVNDVSGLADPEMRFVAAEHGASLIVMHSLDAPVDPDREVTYDDVVGDVLAELAETVLLAERAGLDREQIIVDPGLGFGKSKREEFELLDRTDEFRALGCPILIGHSQKSMYDWVGQDAGDRLESTVAATALAIDRGADIVRVHDVPENVAAVETALATLDSAGYENRRRSRGDAK